MNSQQASGNSDNHSSVGDGNGSDSSDFDGGGTEILIVEDSLTQAMKLQYVLEEHGYRVTVARHGREGLDVLEKRRAEEASGGATLGEATPEALPAVVITDIEMPRMNGYELCAAIKSDERFGAIPVILLTSLSDPADVVKGLECGADSFVVKPYDEAFLLGRIHYIQTNRELRSRSAAGAQSAQNAANAADVQNAGGVEVFFAGHTHVLRATPSTQTTLDLLLGTYETAIHKNQELSRAKETLEQQKEKLEHQAGELARSNAELEKTTAQLRESNEHMQADLNLAREIQQAFILKQYPSFPHHVAPTESALRFSHRYIPTTTLGGDFFDVLALSDTRAGVFICDVMGHGVRSALVTAMMRALVGERTSVATDPGRFLRAINRHLLGILHETRTAMFASAFYLVADASGRMRYANAGHPSPLLARRGTNQVQWLLEPGDPSGPALGVFEDAAFQTEERALDADDFVMLFTDGLVEVEGAEGEYGEERLLEAVRRRISLPPAALYDALLGEIQEFSGSDGFEDDVCLIGMEVALLEPAQ